MIGSIDVSNIVIETDRLILRTFRQADLEDFYEYARVPGTGEMAGWRHHQSKQESQEILDMFLAGKHTFAIELKGFHKVIGSVGVDVPPEKILGMLPQQSVRMLGYVLARNYWGHGLMPEAVKAVIAYCFNNTDINCFVCGHFEGNSQSRRVIEKCGFSYLVDGTYQLYDGSLVKTKEYVLKKSV